VRERSGRRLLRRRCEQRAGKCAGASAPHAAQEVARR
jgi:hypothetical protein